MAVGPADVIRLVPEQIGHSGLELGLREAGWAPMGPRKLCVSGASSFLSGLMPNGSKVLVEPQQI